MRIGILGGTFDPIHIAHLHAGEVALAQLRLDRMLFIPAGDPWQKADEAVSPAQHRVAMTRLGTSDFSGFEVDTREVDRSGPTYTVDTLEALEGEGELFLIAGADAVDNIETWHRHDAVLEKARLAVAPRPGIDVVDLARARPEAVILDMAPLDISSTNIRMRARLGLPYRFLVPAGVPEYIESHDLYAHPRRGDRVGGSTSQEERS